MLFSKKLIFATLIAAVIFACKSKPPESRFDKIAQGFCECTTQLAALNQEAVKLADDTTGKALDIFRSMQVEYHKAKDCTATIVAQYGKIKKEDIPAITKSLEGKCPDLATQRDLLKEMLGE
jgi:hypothetical protein